MSEWIYWLIMAGVVVIFELLTGTFYLLMIAIGLACGAVAAWMGLSQPAQMAVAAIVGVMATLILRNSRFGKFQKSDAARDPNVNIDIGQAVDVDQWHDGRARVMYRGAQWDVELAEGEPEHPGRHVIREVRGNRLIVSHCGSSQP
jgi:membrane protein implicated in regulation of membrane protease activity